MWQEKENEKGAEGVDGWRLDPAELCFAPSRGCSAGRFITREENPLPLLWDAPFLVRGNVMWSMPLRFSGMGMAGSCDRQPSLSAWDREQRAHEIQAIPKRKGGKRDRKGSTFSFNKVSTR